MHSLSPKNYRLWNLFEIFVGEFIWGNLAVSGILGSSAVLLGS